MTYECLSFGVAFGKGVPRRVVKGGEPPQSHKRLCPAYSFQTKNLACRKPKGGALSILDLPTYPMSHTSRALYQTPQVVLDLGRRPEARFLGIPAGEFLREEEVRGASEAG